MISTVTKQRCRQPTNRASAAAGCWHLLGAVAGFDEEEEAEVVVEQASEAGVGSGAWHGRRGGLGALSLLDHDPSRRALKGLPPEPELRLEATEVPFQSALDTGLASQGVVAAAQGAAAATASVAVAASVVGHAGNIVAMAGHNVLGVMQDGGGGGGAGGGGGYGGFGNDGDDGDDEGGNGGGGGGNGGDGGNDSDGGNGGGNGGDGMAVGGAFVALALWEHDHNVRCERCGLGGDLLLCDLCNVVFHMQCLDPPLAAAPEGLWACPCCRGDKPGPVTGCALAVVRSVPWIGANQQQQQQQQQHQHHHQRQYHQQHQRRQGRALPDHEGRMGIGGAQQPQRRDVLSVVGGFHCLSFTPINADIYTLELPARNDENDGDEKGDDDGNDDQGETVRGNNDDDRGGGSDNHHDHGDHRDHPSHLLLPGTPTIDPRSVPHLVPRRRPPPPRPLPAWEGRRTWGDVPTFGFSSGQALELVPGKVVGVFPWVNASAAEKAAELKQVGGVGGLVG